MYYQPSEIGRLILLLFIHFQQRA